jgi:hypothetical protein
VDADGPLVGDGGEFAEPSLDAFRVLVHAHMIPDVCLVCTPDTRGVR